MTLAASRGDGRINLRSFLSLIISGLVEISVLLSVGSFRRTSKACGHTRAWTPWGAGTTTQNADPISALWMNGNAPISAGGCDCVHLTPCPVTLHQTCRGQRDGWAEMICWEGGRGAGREMHKFPAAGAREEQDSGVGGLRCERLLPGAPAGVAGL